MNSLIFISFLFCAISDGLLLDTLTKVPVTSSSFLTDAHLTFYLKIKQTINHDDKTKIGRK
jgi:hypothetical protein